MNEHMNNKDLIDFNKGKSLYTNGFYKESFNLIKSIINKYKDYNKYDNFFVDLIFAYSNVTNIFNFNNEYEDKIEYIINNIDNLYIIYELKIYCKKIYTTNCLKNKDYNGKYLNLINYINGPNVNFNNMSFFKENDKNKILLIYDGGGIGDKFMLSRFIEKLCNKYNNNKVIFFINENLKWIFDNIFKDISNFRIVSYNEPNKIGHFDYHCNLLMLLNYLKIDYDNIIFKPLFINMEYKQEEMHKKLIYDIKNNKNKTYIINWKGNSQNLHEKNNRRMELLNAIPLFKLKNINWIVITKDITKDESLILEKYGVKYYGKLLDNGNNSYEDSISIIRNVEGVFSTDTSLVHLCANLNIKTYVLLTLGCEWRWTKDEKTNWYPNSILIRQNKYNCWENVINKIIELINNDYN